MSNSTAIRQQIWTQLQAVARPDSRYDLDFSQFIPDFEGSALAVDRLLALPEYQTAGFLFVAHDNALAGLRSRLIAAGTTFIMPTIGIRRGFVLMAPGMVPAGHEEYAGWLDGMERFARPVSLQDIAHQGRIDLLVTGASAVSTDGLRFGKGQGVFDLEWAMLSALGLVDDSTPIAALVHDCQVVDERLYPGSKDILVDIIATPQQLHRIERRARRPRGVDWGQILPRQISQIPPLQELRRVQGLG